MTPSPKPSPRRDYVHRGRDDAFERRTPAAEPRSFAPNEQGLRAVFGGDAEWPNAWEPLSLDSFVGLPRGDAPANDVMAAADRRRRALIVIPALNEAAVIASVIERVLDDDGLVDPLVLVADGGSTDGTREIVARIAAEDRRVRLIHNPGRLQSAGLNLAVQTMAGDRPWVVRVDAHADYPKNYASTLIAEAMRTGAASVVVSMDTIGQTPFQRAVAAAQNSVLGTGGSAHRLASEGQWVDHGHHALFSREAFQLLGGYDESFSHNEDAEFDLRLTRQGGRIWLTDKARIGYYPRQTPRALAKQYFSYGKGRCRTVLKHYTPLKLRQAAPLAVAPAAAGLALTPLFWAFALPALLWIAASLSLGVMLAAKKRDAAVLASGPAAMIMHLAWSAGFWAQLFVHAANRKPGYRAGAVPEPAA